MRPASGSMRCRSRPIRYWPVCARDAVERTQVTMAKIDLELTINGEKVVAPGIDGDRKLVDFLREDLSLTGTKFGCGIAVCRVCTVALQRVPGAHCEAIRSC